MEMDRAVREAVNDQINREFFAGYLYLAMSAHFEAESLGGFARWMRLQAQEELGHAMRLVDYLNRRGAKVELRAIEQPATGFGSHLSVFEKALAHEQIVTASIDRLYALAREKGDYATQRELQWFVVEQVEEEGSVGAIVERLRLAGDDSAALLMLDRELGRAREEE